MGSAVTLTPLYAQEAAKPETPAAPAAEAPAAPAAPATEAPVAPAVPPIDKALVQGVEDFYHYASVARFELAKAAGEKLVAAGEGNPAELVRAFDAVIATRNERLPAERRIDLYERLLAWQNIEPLKDVSAKLLSTFDKAKQSRAADLGFIEQNLSRLDKGRRAYALAIETLKESGELVVPVMLAYLKDASKKDLHPYIRAAIRDLGQRALSPLLAATEMKDWETLKWVVVSLGDLGYDAAVPYLVRLAKCPQAPGTIKLAATESLMRLNGSSAASLDASQLFYDLAEKFYYERVSIAPAPGAATAMVWFWTEAGLSKVDVPAAVFNECMAMRACEAALKINAARGDAISLWLAAGFRREAELEAAKATDTFWDEKHPNTHFYAVDSGTRHLSPVLARALKDKDAALALKAIQSLQQILGANTLGSEAAAPVLNAMQSLDRQVRFEAALTIAQSLPQAAFSGQEKVVPILAEAIAPAGKAAAAPTTAPTTAPAGDAGNMDEKVATDYALRAADVLGKLAISRGQVLDLAVAKIALMGALDDSRPEVVKAAAAVLAATNFKDNQQALLAKALDEKTAEELKAVLLKSVAINAKFNGNQVGNDQAKALQDFVAAATNADVRAAAAEALGALNLSADQIKGLIVNQAK